MHNNRFYDSLKQFCVAGLQVLSDFVRSGNEIPLEGITEYVIASPRHWTKRRSQIFDWEVFVFLHEEQLQKLSSHRAVVEVMESDPTIVRHLNTNVGTAQLAYLIDKNEFLVSVIRALLQGQDGTEFKEDIFQTLYEGIEEFFFTDSLKFRALALLTDFRMDAHCIELGDSVRLRSLTEQEQSEILKDAEESLVRPFIRLPYFCIEYLFSCPKVIAAPPQASNLLPSEQAGQLFTDVISALRLFKRGQVASFNTRILGLSWQGIGTVTESFQRISSFGPPYILTSAESTEFGLFWQGFKKSRRTGRERVDLALRRFNFGFERTRAEDSLLDYIIGFEALLLGDQPELSYKLGMRAAALLGETPTERELIFNELREAYKLRSGIVHRGHSSARPVKIGDETLSFIEFIHRIEYRLRSAIKAALIASPEQKRDAFINALDKQIARGYAH